MALTQMRKFKQQVMSAPRRIPVKRYLTPKGKFLLLSASTKKDKAAIWEKYGKNRYRINPESRPIKIIEHFVLG